MPDFLKSTANTRKAVEQVLIVQQKAKTFFYQCVPYPH